MKRSESETHTGTGTGLHRKTFKIRVRAQVTDSWKRQRDSWMDRRAAGI